MTAAIVTSDRLSANQDGGAYMWHLTENQRQDVYALMAVHGYPVLEPKNRPLVAAVSYDVIDCPILRFELFAQDEAGEIVWDEDLQTCVFVSRDVLLRTPLPDWWRPDTEDNT